MRAPDSGAGSVVPFLGPAETPALSCYRVLMFDPGQRLYWRPIFVARSPIEAERRAIVLYPWRTGAVAGLLHGSDIQHGIGSGGWRSEAA